MAFLKVDTQILTSPIRNHYIDSTLQDIHATLQQIEQIANEDIEMQVSSMLYSTLDDTTELSFEAPPSESTRFLVIDTNVLLDHLEVLEQFVKDIKEWNLPVIVVIPGIVIQELDGYVFLCVLRQVQTSCSNRQKKVDNKRAMLARHASKWLLAMVKERQVVKGQANEETCKSSGNWKVRAKGEVSHHLSAGLLCVERGQVVQSNDEFILDCCQYYFRQELRTYLCTSDVNLGIGSEIAERDGIIWALSSLTSHKWSPPRPHSNDLPASRTKVEQYSYSVDNPWGRV